MSAFYPGQKVSASGIYRAVHYKHRESDEHIALVAGDIFPHCWHCDDLTEYYLVHPAPSIRDNPDVWGKI